MAAKIRIKDIAQMAGVSPGTVDRVIHNRGHISPDKKAAVEAAIKKLNYHTNIHVSAISIKRSYRISIVIPEFKQGDYWSKMIYGITQALAKYSALDIDCNYCHYNQFDLFSCRETYDKILETKPDAVVIGPTFRDEALYLANQLTDAGIPYIFIDSLVQGAAPLAYFMADLDSTGYSMARLITSIISPGSEIAIMQAVRVGDESANTTIIRKRGFLRYCSENQIKNKICSVPFNPADQKKNEEAIDGFFEKNKNVEGVVVLNSRGYVMADYFRKHKMKHLKMIAIDLIDKNIDAMREGYIDFLISQRPAQQGYLAITTLLEHLVYSREVQVKNIMPIDIIFNENLNTHLEFNGFSKI